MCGEAMCVSTATRNVAWCVCCVGYGVDVVSRVLIFLFTLSQRRGEFTMIGEYRNKAIFRPQEHQHNKMAGTFSSGTNFSLHKIVAPADIRVRDGSVVCKNCGVRSQRTQTDGETGATSCEPSESIYES